eukprot:COSAG02_NODE_1355_length_13099_cov_10.562923_3_plen_67_part_00
MQCQLGSVNNGEWSEHTLRIKDPVSQRLHTVLRKHCRKTSVTQMRRKEGRAKAWTRRRQGIGAVVS